MARCLSCGRGFVRRSGRGSQLDAIKGCVGVPCSWPARPTLPGRGNLGSFGPSKPSLGSGHTVIDSEEKTHQEKTYREPSKMSSIILCNVQKFYVSMLWAYILSFPRISSPNRWELVLYTIGNVCTGTPYYNSYHINCCYQLRNFEGVEMWGGVGKHGHLYSVTLQTGVFGKSFLHFSLFFLLTDWRFMNLGFW